MQLAVDSAGGLVAVGLANDTQGYVARIRPDGTLDRPFGNGGTVVWPYRDGFGWNAAAFRADGSIVLAGSTQFGSGGVGARLAATVLTARGRPDTSFGAGTSLEFPPCLRTLGGLAVTATRIYLSALDQCTQKSAASYELVALDPSGRPAAGFSRNGATAVGPAAAEGPMRAPVLTLADGGAAVATTAVGGNVALRRFLADGRLDRHFGRNGVATSRVAPDSLEVATLSAFRGRLGRFTVGGCAGAGPFLTRFNLDGSPYNFWGGGSNGGPSNVENFGGAFGSSCAAFAGLTDLRVAAAGNVLARLNTTGLLDPTRPVLPLHPFQYLSDTPPRLLVAGPHGTVFVASHLANGDTVITHYR